MGVIVAGSRGRCRNMVSGIVARKVLKVGQDFNCLRICRQRDHESSKDHSCQRKQLEVLEANALEQRQWGLDQHTALVLDLAAREPANVLAHAAAALVAEATGVCSNPHSIRLLLVNCFAGIIEAVNNDCAVTWELFGLGNVIANITRV